MLRQIVLSAEIYLKFIWNLYDIYQQGLSKVNILKHSTQVAISTAFRRAPCT